LKKDAHVLQNFDIRLQVYVVLTQKATARTISALKLPVSIFRVDVTAFLKMESAYSCGSSVSVYRTTQCHNLEDHNLMFLLLFKEFRFSGVSFILKIPSLYLKGHGFQGDERNRMNDQQEA
jgi:hypothetical protein